MSKVGKFFTPQEKDEVCYFLSIDSIRIAVLLVESQARSIREAFEFEEAFKKKPRTEFSNGLRRDYYNLGEGVDFVELRLE